VSCQSVAAALALDGRVAVGERLAAFSLASFTNREHRAWPGTRVAATRAGLSRSQFLAARDSLVRRGLVRIESAGGGRGNSPVVFLVFAEVGPWADVNVNAPLFEAILSYSRSRGSARLLLAALAALSADDRSVAGVSTEELRAAAGVSDSTYRRARTALLASGEVRLEEAGGGRAKTNRWVLSDPRANGAAGLLAAQRRPPLPGPARPLVTAARVKAPAAPTPAATVASSHGSKGPDLNGVSVKNPGQDRTVSAVKGPGSGGLLPRNTGQDRTVSELKGPGLSGVSTRNPAQNRTVSAQTPPQTPSFTPSPYAPAGREPQNLSTFPPNPPGGGSSPGQVTVVETYLSERGRRRKRAVVVDLDVARRQLRPPGAGDRDVWAAVRGELLRMVGESTFEIWLTGLELVAVNAESQLLLSCPTGTRAWVSSRFAGALNRAASRLGHAVRVADDRELQLLHALAAVPDSSSHSVDLDQKEAV
jgi:hypothetical protein